MMDLGKTNTRLFYPPTLIYKVLKISFSLCCSYVEYISGFIFRPATNLSVNSGLRFTFQLFQYWV